MPSYLKHLPFHVQMNVFGEDVGYCMCRDRVKRGLTHSQLLEELPQSQIRCTKEVTSKWNTLSSIENPPNPLGHPQRRALHFQDIVCIPPQLVGESLEQILLHLGMLTGICGCNRQEDYELHRLNGVPLTRHEWSELGNSFFDACRKDIGVDWLLFALQGQGVPQGLPAPSRNVRPRPGFNPDLNWIPHPHGLSATLSRLHFKGLAAAASKARQEVWNFGKEERLLLKGLESGGKSWDDASLIKAFLKQSFGVLANQSKHAPLQARSNFEPPGGPGKAPGYLKDHPLVTQVNVFGEELGYCMCRDRVKRRLTSGQFRKELRQIHVRCANEVTSEWDRLSGMLNPPNPMGHPQRRALDFQDIVYIPPEMVGQTLEQIIFELGMSIGFCGCDLREHHELHVIMRKLTNREWSKQGNSFFDDCRKETAADWILSATQGEAVPQGLPAPFRTTRPETGFNPDFNWIPHPLGLGRLNFKGLAAAASRVRQKVWDFGKEEGLLLRGLESYLDGHPFHTQMNVFGEEIGYCICRDQIEVHDSTVLEEIEQMKTQCQGEVNRQWAWLSSLDNPPNPMGHPHHRALDFRDIVYILPELVGKSLDQITFDLGVTTGYCGCQQRDHVEIHVIKRKLTNREWRERGSAFFDTCRTDIASDWIVFATEDGLVPHPLPASSRTRPGFNPDLNWIPHPHGLGVALSRFNVKGLDAAASKFRQEAWKLGKEEGALIRAW
ncbi:MAG: hypothetical protein M1826_001808 [Phylliscum demangeonii]|nr:MAG: hypothetical protein M1826_001808 [Phylliscum demangeonii]